MAHQTAASHSPAQLPEHRLQLGYTMKKTSLAKEKKKRLDKYNSLYGTTYETEYKMEHNTLLRTVAARILVDGCVVAFDSGGSHREGTVD